MLEINCWACNFIANTCSYSHTVYNQGYILVYMPDTTRIPMFLCVKILCCSTGLPTKDSRVCETSLECWPPTTARSLPCCSSDCEAAHASKQDLQVLVFLPYLFH